MAEAITEMIIPGTYIEVRSEGLIGVSGIATGNVGVVGTASKGPVDEVVILSSFADAKDTFGDYDAWAGGSNDELTLVRALQLAFSNGASTVYAVRTAQASVAAASRTLGDGTGDVVTFTGITPGTWGQNVTVQIKAAGANAVIESRKQTVAGGVIQPLHANIAASSGNLLKVIKGSNGKILRFALKTSGAPASGRTVVVNAAGALTFHADDAPVNGDVITATYQVDKGSCREVVIAYGAVKEVYEVADADDLKGDVARLSKLVSVTIAAGGGPRLPDITSEPLPLSGASDGAHAGVAEYQLSLANLDAEDVNIVCLAGMSATSAAALLEAHVETAENNGRDRIAVVGADSDDLGTVASNADAVSDDRLILVAPGVTTSDLAAGAEADLPPAYSAAAIAGLIASLAVQVSPTNKTLAVAGLTSNYNDGQIKKLIESRVLVLEKKAGYRVVKGITTDIGAFRQISVRRIVDYAKAGTRIGCLAYIGKLNNARVRAALKATLNGFLSDMVLNEALVDFQLQVTATREQEIAGVCLVTMYLKPTFSIDYIKVIMNLA
jgi:hypothetical protein